MKRRHLNTQTGTLKRTFKKTEHLFEIQESTPPPPKKKINRIEVTQECLKSDSGRPTPKWPQNKLKEKALRIAARLSLTGHAPLSITYFLLCFCLNMQRCLSIRNVLTSILCFIDFSSFSSLSSCPCLSLPARQILECLPLGPLCGSYIVRFFRARSKKRTQGDKPSPNADSRWFSLIFADSRLFLENEAFGETQIFRRKPLIFAGDRRKLQEPEENRKIGVCPLRFVPLSAALLFPLVRSPVELHIRKIRAPIKIKSALPPPPPKTPPQKKGNFTDTVFPAERTLFFSRCP